MDQDDYYAMQDFFGKGGTREEWDELRQEKDAEERLDRLEGNDL